MTDSPGDPPIDSAGVSEARTTTVSAKPAIWRTIRSWSAHGSSIASTVFSSNPESDSTRLYVPARTSSNAKCPSPSVTCSCGAASVAPAGRSVTVTPGRAAPDASTAVPASAVGPDSIAIAFAAIAINTAAAIPTIRCLSCSITLVPPARRESNRDANRKDAR